MTLQNNATWQFDINENAAYTFRICISRSETASTTAVVGAVIKKSMPNKP
jgi:hypothetical protein